MEIDTFNTELEVLKATAVDPAIEHAACLLQTALRAHQERRRADRMAQARPANGNAVAANMQAFGGIDPNKADGGESNGCRVVTVGTTPPFTTIELTAAESRVFDSIVRVAMGRIAQEQRIKDNKKQNAENKQPEPETAPVDTMGTARAAWRGGLLYNCPNGHCQCVKEKESTRCCTCMIGITFGDALEWLFAGKRLQREGWAAAAYIALQKGYPDGIPINQNTADATGLKLGTVCVFNPYILFGDGDEFEPWVASQDDVLATDWQVVAD